MRTSRIDSVVDKVQRHKDRRGGLWDTRTGCSVVKSPMKSAALGREKTRLVQKKAHPSCSERTRGSGEAGPSTGRLTHNGSPPFFI